MLKHQALIKDAAIGKLKTVQSYDTNDALLSILCFYKKWRGTPDPTDKIFVKLN